MDDVKLDDDTFEICDGSLNGCSSETKDKFIEVNEKVEALNSFFDEMGGFVAKQLELFSTLNTKFPNISQFSTALNEAKDINSSIDTVRDLSADIEEDLESLKSSFNEVIKEQNSENDVSKLISQLLSNLKEVSKDEEAIDLLNKIIFKIEQ